MLHGDIETAFSGCTCLLGVYTYLSNTHNKRWRAQFQAAVAKMSELVVATSFRNVITVQRVTTCFSKIRYFRPFSQEKKMSERDWIVFPSLTKNTIFLLNFCTWMFKITWESQIILNIQIGISLSLFIRTNF